MRGRRRPAVAAVLALAVAGLGHAYLRRWGRAAAWFLTIVTTAVVLIGVFADPNASIEELPLTVMVPLIGLFILSAVDAYLLAARASAPAASGRERAQEAADEDERTQCPNCGHEVDPELDFCHWCTQRLSFDADPDETHEPRREGG